MGVQKRDVLFFNRRPARETLPRVVDVIAILGPQRRHRLGVAAVESLGKSLSRLLERRFILGVRVGGVLLGDRGRGWLLCAAGRLLCSRLLNGRANSRCRCQHD